MKGLHAKDILGNDPEELLRTLAKLQGELFQHRLKRSTNQLENTMLIRTARREIARVNTVLAERQMGIVRSAAVAAKGSAQSASPVTEHEQESAAPRAPAAAAKMTKTTTKKAAAKKPAAKKEK